MDRLTERTAVGILVKENYEKESLKTLYSCYGEKPNPHYTNCEEGYCAMEKLADYEDAEEHGLPLRWIPCSEQDKVYPFRAFWNGINFTDGMNILDVIAWMPLPKPYREREE